MRAFFHGIEITSPHGEEFLLRGARSLVIHCKGFDRLRAALERRFEYGHHRDAHEKESDGEISISLEVLIWKKKPRLNPKD